MERGGIFLEMIDPILYQIPWDGAANFLEF